MEGARDLLFAMSIATRENAVRVLSEEGREVLEMIELVDKNSRASVADIWVEAKAADGVFQGRARGIGLAGEVSFSSTMRRCAVRSKRG